MAEAGVVIDGTAAGAATEEGGTTPAGGADIGFCGTCGEVGASEGGLGIPGAEGDFGIMLIPLADGTGGFGIMLTPLADGAAGGFGIPGTDGGLGILAVPDNEVGAPERLGGFGIDGMEGGFGMVGIPDAEGAETEPGEIGGFGIFAIPCEGIGLGGRLIIADSLGFPPRDWP